MFNYLLKMLYATFTASSWQLNNNISHQNNCKLCLPNKVGNKRNMHLNMLCSQK